MFVDATGLYFHKATEETLYGWLQVWAAVGESVFALGRTIEEATHDPGRIAGGVWAAAKATVSHDAWVEGWGRLDAMGQGIKSTVEGAYDEISSGSLGANSGRVIGVVHLGAILFGAKGSPNYGGDLKGYYTSEAGASEMAAMTGRIGGVEANAGRAVLNSLPEITAAEIRLINQGFGGATELTGSAETVIANMFYRTGATNKASTAIRDIAGRHLFNDANKRTAQAVAERILGTNANQAHIRSVINRVALGELRSIEDIAAALGP